MRSGPAPGNLLHPVEHSLPCGAEATVDQVLEKIRLRGQYPGYWRCGSPKANEHGNARLYAKFSGGGRSRKAYPGGAVKVRGVQRTNGILVGYSNSNAILVQCSHRGSPKVRLPNIRRPSRGRLIAWFDNLPIEAPPTEAAGAKREAKTSRAVGLVQLAEQSGSCVLEDTFSNRNRPLMHTQNKGVLMIASPNKSAGREIEARMDRIPKLTPFHRKLMVVLTALFFFDLVDLAAFSFVAPAIRAEWGLSIEQLGLLTSSVFVGMVLGGLIGGRLADRFGRRRVVLVGVAVFSLASLASAFAPGIETLLIARVITGLGLTATTGVVLVMVSELFPKPFLGRVMAIVLGFATLGVPTIAIIARIVVPMGAWRSIFVVGALGLVVVLAAMKFLPESPRWLESRGRIDEADRGMKVVEENYLTRYRTALPAPIVHDEARLVQKASYIELFRRRTVLRTVAATLIFGFQVQLTYGIGQWLPVLLIERGTPQADALTFAMILTFGQVAGTLVSSLVLDRFERKTTLAVAAAVVVIGYLLMGFIPTIPVLLIAGFIANIALSFVIAATFTFVPEVFPSHIRGTGAGFANGIGRLAGVAGSFIISAVIISYSTVGVFVYLAGVAFALILITFISPTTGVKQARRDMKAASSEAKTEPQLR